MARSDDRKAVFAVQGKEMTRIGAKAFLSRKDLREIELPDTVCEIGDWAFAHASNLQAIYWKNSKSHELSYYGEGTDEGCDKNRQMCHKITLGKQVFLGCTSLQKICFETDTEEGVGYLRAASVVLMGVSEILAAEEAVYRDLDRQLLPFLERDELLGFSPMQAGGEEDYENEQEQRKRYQSQSRQNKAEFCLLRLLYDSELDQVLRREIESWLQEHREEAWQCVLNRHLQEKIYYKILHSAVCFQPSKIADMLVDLEKRGAGAEVRAYVLQSVEKAKEDSESMWTKFQL